MAAKIFRINYKSDFILTMNSDAGWAIPFCIKFWTSVPSRAYFVGFDGTTYTHCAYDPSEPTKLVVQFDDHHLPIGDLNYQIAYHFTVADFPNDTEDEVINPAAITTEIDGDTYHVMLDFTGETAPEIEFNLPAYANEQQRIANEEQRIANEEARVEAEQQRVEEFTEAEQRINAIITEGETAVNNANAAATNANQKAAAAQTAAQNANESATEAAEAASDARSAGESAEAAGQQATTIATAAAQRAESAATAANQAAQAAQQQATGAGKVNAQLSGTVITITNRDGVASSIDVMDSIQEFVDDINSVLDMINGEVI